MKRCIDFTGNILEYECMGCDIANKKITPPGGLIYDGESCVLASDPEVPLPGFLILNTKRHIKSFADFSNHELEEVSKIVRLAVCALKDLNIVEEVTLVQEERSSHLHIWIYPNYNDMNDKYGKGITYFRQINKDVKNSAEEEDKTEVLSTVEKIKEYFANNCENI